MSAMYLHHVVGCAPAPLAHYLKALGILRVLAEQRDPGARGWWQDDHWCLLTRLDRAAIEQFFLADYAPAPLVSPWNKGSGFYNRSDPSEVLSRIEKSRAPRLEPYRRAMTDALEPLSSIAEADRAVRALKDSTKAKKGMAPAAKKAAIALKSDAEFKKKCAEADRNFHALKADLLSSCQRTWRGLHRTWMDAAVVLLIDGSANFPSLVGTGGNDGNIDFTNNAMQRLGELFDLESGVPAQAASGLLRECLWCEKVPLSSDAGVGQFLPGSAGGANSATGPLGASSVNPWDFVLMLEGVLLFRARATCFLDGSKSSRASAPFALESHAVGYGTAGNENTARGEQWMPLWSQPASLEDLRSMLGEARMQLGRTAARRPLDAARAMSRLGVARGIGSFARYGYLERNGRSTFAVPLGRIDVAERPRSRLVDELSSWLDRLRRLAQDKNAPARLVQAERRLGDAVFAVLTHQDSPDRWQTILRAAADVEAIEASGTAITAGPLPELSPAWLDAADDGTAEWRLACALGSAAGSYPHGQPPIDRVRHHWLPLERGARRFCVRDKHLALDPRVVALGRDPLADFAAIVDRRLVEAAQHGARRLPLVAAAGFEASPCDLGRLVAGTVDVFRIAALARSLMAIRWERAVIRRHEALEGSWPDEAWQILRIACLPWPLDAGHAIPADQALVRRLVSGDAATALELASRRLGAAGLYAPVRGVLADAATATAWAAALAFPLSLSSARAMASAFQPSTSHP